MAATMRIVFLAVNDEFAGSMQRYIYEQHPEWIVGSVVSTRSIYKKSKFGAVLFVMRKSGVRYGAEMFRMKMLRKLIQKERHVTPVQLANEHKVGIFYSTNINDDSSVNQLMSWTPEHFARMTAVFAFLRAMASKSPGSPVGRIQAEAIRRCS